MALSAPSHRHQGNDQEIDHIHPIPALQIGENQNSHQKIGANQQHGFTEGSHGHQISKQLSQTCAVDQHPAIEN